MAEFIFTLAAIAQGSFVIGYTIFILIYYLPKKKNHIRHTTKRHVILISLSYILLTTGTVWTAVHGFYSWGNFWYWAIFLGYTIGDIGLIMIFRTISRRDAKIKLE